MAYSPRLLGQPAKPSQIGEKLAKTWDILSPYVTGPVDAWKGLMEADLNTLLYDKGAGGRKAVEDAFNVAGTVTGGSSVVPKPANALNMGIKAYHGSPHSFDKFDMSKIGTGEGAQAYGHGLYFAENEGVAKGYRDTLAKSKNVDGAMNAAWEKAAEWSDKMKAATSDTEFLAAKKEYEAAVDAAKNMAPSNPGSMYEVNIDADPNAEFINYDAPWADQPQKVKDAYGYLAKRQPDGSELARRIEAPVFAQEAADRGVKGIQYLDAGSRGAGDGTRNYVVFDDKLISIVRKYGIAGASAMLGYNVLEGMDKAQADTLNKADFDYRADEFYRQGGV